MNVDVDYASSNSYNDEHILDTVEGEIYFFRAMMRARPLGVHRHFHVMCIQREIVQGLGIHVSTQDVWNKLHSCYNMEALEALEGEHDTPGPSDRQTSQLISPPSPSPSQNLATHPYFQGEFTLPDDPFIETLVSTRRMNAAGSAASSPMSAQPLRKTKLRTRRRDPSKVEMAGLVSGDSDSSALTQESGDDDQGSHWDAPTPRSVVTATATDGGTEAYDDSMDVDEFGVDISKGGTHKKGKKSASTGKSRTGGSTKNSSKRRRR